MTDWPAHEAELLQWPGSSARGPREDRMLTHYEATIPPQIAGVSWEQDAETSTLSDEAIAAIVRLDATAGQVLAPLTSFLLRNEAQSSSKIERVETTQDDLARATLGIRASEDARSTVAAAEAISALIDSASTGCPANVPALLASHFALMKDDRLDGRHAGQLRTRNSSRSTRSSTATAESAGP